MTIQNATTNCGRRALLSALALGVATSVSLTIASPVQAGNLTEEQLLHIQFLQDNGASQRIDFSGKLRMLSQRIPAAACNYVAGIDPEASGAILTAAVAEFQQIVDALEFGDPSLGIIGVEERRKTLVGLRKLRELWEPMLVEANSISATGGTIENVIAIADVSASVLEIAKLLVSEISGQYSDPTALLQVDALAIDIAGRQRMLSQRMSKNVCLIASGVNVETATGELNAAAQTFDVSLNALRNGLADAGIKAPPTEQIVTGLDTVIADWAGLQQIVTRTAKGETIDDEVRDQMFNGANMMTGNMNTVVGMYSEASKLKL
jgi:nitrate/nitrite-specific signal transduction histidine kinase